MVHLKAVDTLISFSRAKCVAYVATSMTNLTMTLQQGVGCRTPMLWYLGIPGNSLPCVQMSQKRLSPVTWNHIGSHGQRKNAASSEVKSLKFVIPRFVEGSDGTAQCISVATEQRDHQKWMKRWWSSDLQVSLYSCRCQYISASLNQSSLSICGNGTVSVVVPPSCTSPSLSPQFHCYYCAS